jgi:hypothetical protein
VVAPVGGVPCWNPVLLHDPLANETVLFFKVPPLSACNFFHAPTKARIHPRTPQHHSGTQLFLWLSNN